MSRASDEPPQNNANGPDGPASRVIESLPDPPKLTIKIEDIDDPHPDLPTTVFDESGNVIEFELPGPDSPVILVKWRGIA